MSRYIAWLDSPEAASAARTGGKGASLARLGSAGFAVPPGFVVTADGYHAFHRLLGLDDLLDALDACPQRPTAQQVRDACAPILAVLAASTLPADLAREIAAAYDALEARTGDSATFAVRSSGMSEDGATASFAGLYDSYLNLRGPETVLDRVRDCYHCLWQPRAAHYRAIKGIAHRGEAMGVVVMQTVASRVSGVAFTLNPLTLARDEVLINASWGLGEAVVSGMVTPDNYVVGKDGAIRQKDISEKEIEVVAVPGGTEQRPITGARARQPALTSEEIGIVARTAAAVEEHYGRPMDIEFAFDDDGRFFVLQARPVTTGV